MAEKTSGRFRSVAILLLLVALGAAGYVWHTRRAAPGAKQAQTVRPPAPVSVATIATGSFPVDINSIGSVQALNTVAVRSRVDGQIEKLFFREGQMVKAGDLLVQLDARPFKAALDQVLAKKAQDEATLNNARLDLARYSRLAKNSFATEQQLNTQQATVASDQALVQSDQAAIENAQTQLGYAKIQAPIAGRIGFRQLDLGNIVHANDTQPILTIVQVDPINVLFTVPEDQVYAVRQAMLEAPLKTDVYTSDGATLLRSGVVSVINNQVDANTGTVQIKAEFENSQMKLWPGQSVTVVLHVHELQNVVIAPSTAVQQGQDGLYAWVVDKQNRAEIRKIDVSMQAGGKAVVTSGLAGGDTVVVGGQYRLFDKAPVVVRAAPPSGPREASAK